jgi:hypothetical protein
MLGLLPDVRHLLAIAALAVGVGCVKNVNPDAKSGADAKWKGAKPIVLQMDEGEANGIVTYPGGDRVDWKLVELPDGKRGDLDLVLSWRPPRPGLDLAFDVYDEWGTKLGGVKPKKASTAKKAKKRKRSSKKTTISDARGKIYIQIYASTRGDAGKYKLRVAFQEQVVGKTPTFDPGSADIPEPPRLAAVPPPCDPSNIDKKNPECAGVHPPCDPAKPDRSNPNCSGIHPPCDPNALDPTNPECLKFYPDCDETAPDPKNPKCRGVKRVRVAQKGMVTDIQVATGGVVIQINRGTDHGVDKDWTGEIVDGSGRPIQNGGFQIYKVQKTRAFAKVKLGRDVVNKNLNVNIYPP